MIDTATFDGAPAGSNVARPAHEIDDSQARYIQDGFVDQPGIIRQRGVVIGAATIPAFGSTRTGVGLAHAKQPDGTSRVALLNENVTNAKITVFASNLGTFTDLPWGSSGFHANPYEIIDTKPALGGGAVIGSSGQLTNTALQTLGFWHGAGKVQYTTGSVNLTATGTTVTGTGTLWSTNAEPGMYLFATISGSLTYIGVVKSVNSDTSLTLVDPSPWSASTVAYQLQATRGFQQKYTRGVITTSTSSKTVTGGDTRFLGNLKYMLGGPIHLFRKSTGEFIGAVDPSAIHSDTSLDLTANALLNLDAEPFVALLVGGNMSPNTMAVGFLSVVHKGRQFYANKTDTAVNSETVWYSDTGDKEALDMNPTDGSFFRVTSSNGTNAPLAALASTENALLFLKENEVFAMTGDEPEQWAIDRLPINDGTLSTMSVQQIDDGVIFAGRRGIYRFDGSGVANLVEGNLGPFYHDLVSTFDPATYRMWSMVARNHYFLFIESVTPPYTPIKGATSQSVTRMTIAINLPTNAVTFMTNLDIRGAAELPASSEQESMFIINTSTGPVLASSLDLFASVNKQVGSPGTDSVVGAGNVAGPNFYVETKRYPLGDALRKKLFKEVLLTYLTTNDTLTVDVITGLSDAGTTLSSTFPISSTFTTARLKFLKRTQLLGFRIYGTTGNLKDIKLGPWALGFKLMRPGRP